MITKKQAEEIIKLIEEWTKCEILSRFGPWPSPVCWAHRQIEIADQLREKALGSSDLLVLAARWKMLEPEKKKKAEKSLTRMPAHKKTKEKKKESEPEIHPLLIHKMNKHKKEKGGKPIQALLNQLEVSTDSSEKRSIRKELRRLGHVGGLKKGS